VSIKAKWDKLHFWNVNTDTWLFTEGRMIVISKAKSEHKKEVTSKNKNYALKNVIKEKGVTT
jgi:hypothetical protein